MRDRLMLYRRMVLVGLLLLSLLLLWSANLRRQETTTLFERSVLAVSSPVLKLIDGCAAWLGEGWYAYVWLVRVRQENENLAEQVRQLQARLQLHQEYQQENERLRRLLNFAQSQPRHALPSRVIGEDLAGWARTVVVDKGTADGLKEGLPVVVAEGVVGQIIKCGPHEARVLLVIDPSAAIGSLVQRTRTRGITRGSGEGLGLEFADRDTPIEMGDMVISSGLGGVFPKGLPIGRVTRVERGDMGMFQRVELEPVVDFSRLEEVLVLLEAGK